MNWYLKALKQYADFNGRARRKEYWMFTLFNIIILYAFIILGAVLQVSFLMILGGIYIFGSLLPAIAVTIRRMHDVGKSGWYCLIPIYSLILACTDSDNGSNEYGDNPKGIGNNASIDQIGVE